MTEMNKILKKLTCSDEYLALRTDEERIKLALRLLQENKTLLDTKNKEKDVLTSIEYRNKANRLFTMPRFEGMKLKFNSIIKSYTKSIAYAPPGSQELALSYANRSEALFTARLYDHCLRDIERALKLDYPDKLKAKLFVEKAQCLIVLNSSTSESEKALTEARRWLEKMDLNDPDRECIEKLLNDPQQMESIEQPRILLDDERYLPEIPNKNSEVQGASSAIELKYSDKFERHFVATRDIDPGEVLVVQQSYAHLVHMEKRYINCEHCLKQTWSGVPCDYCVEWIYCSEACRDAAWIDYHDVECQIAGSLIILEAHSLLLFALRLTVRAVKEAGSLQALKDQLAAIDSSSDLRTRGFTGNVLDGMKYASIYSLKTNTESRSVSELSRIILNSVIILYMLATRSSMFGRKLDGNQDILENNEWMIFIGKLIIKHDQIVKTNAHSVSEVGAGKNVLSRGNAITPSICLFNHSCDSNTTSCSMGRNIVIIATQIIKKDEQIFFYYGPSYTYMSKTDRQVELKKHYHFTCECIACKEDWPLFNDLPSFTELNLPKQLEDMLHATQETFSQYRELVLAKDVETKPEIITGLANLMKIFNEHVHVPCIEVPAICSPLTLAYDIRGNRCQSLD